MSKKVRQLCGMLLVLLAMSGCALLKASPRQATSFIPFREGIDEPAARLGPFHGLLYLKQQKFLELNQKFRRWYIAPIYTRSLEEKIRAAEGSPFQLQGRIDELAEIARYTRVTFAQALSSNTTCPVTISDTAATNALTLELALVEVEPTFALLNLASAIAGFFIPGTGIVQVFASGSIAIEGIVRDGKTGEVLMEFKDREADKNAFFSLKDFQRYAHLQTAVREWADQFATLVASNGTTIPEESLPVTLNPL